MAVDIQELESNSVYNTSNLAVSIIFHHPGTLYLFSSSINFKVDVLLVVREFVVNKNTADR